MILQSFASDPSSLQPRRTLPRQQLLAFPREEQVVDPARDTHGPLKVQPSLKVLGELAGVVLIFLVFLTLAAIL